MPAVGKRKWRLLSVAIGAALIAVSAGAIGLWLARSRVVDDPATRVVHAYKSGQWTIAADLAARSSVRKRTIKAALRVLARASTRLGRDDVALAIYQRRLDETDLEADDHLSLGLLFQRKGAEGFGGTRVEESDRGDRGFTSSARGDLSLKCPSTSLGRSDPGGRPAPPSAGLGGTGIGDAWHYSCRTQ